jgi:hypothetical protein
VYKRQEGKKGRSEEGKKGRREGEHNKGEVNHDFTVS